MKKNFRKIVYPFILAAALLGFAIRIFLFPELSQYFHLGSLIASLFLITYIFEAHAFVNKWLNKTYPYAKNPINRMIIQSTFGVLIMVLVWSIIYVFFFKNLPNQVTKFSVLATFGLYVLIGIGINVGFFANYYFNNWKEEIKHTERLEKEKTEVQFENLKNQLNPHFLFNSLTSLNSLIFENQDLASNYLKHLSKVYRYILSHKEKDLVTLETEIEFVKNYIFLAETRYKGFLKINFTINKSVADKKIVPVTLQILVENALKHNVIDADNFLTIQLYTESDFLVVENNVQKKKLVEASNKQGLEKLTSLYRFLTEKPVIIENTTYIFKVKIPLID